MIIGAHVILYSKDAESDRIFFRDFIRLPGIDSGEGWLIFGLPPSEVAVHPAEKNDIHELYLQCDNIQSFIARLRKRGVACTPPMERGWGVLTQVTLPGGGKIGVYEPSHPRPTAARAKSRGRKKSPPKKGSRRKAKRK